MSPSVSSKLLEGEQVLVHLDTGFCYVLQGVGSRAWELLEGGATAESLAESLLQEYRVDRRRLRRDVEGLLAELGEHHLIIEEP